MIDCPWLLASLLALIDGRYPVGSYNCVITSFQNFFSAKDPSAHLLPISHGRVDENARGVTKEVRLGKTFWYDSPRQGW